MKKSRVIKNIAFNTLDNLDVLEDYVIGPAYMGGITDAIRFYINQCKKNVNDIIGIIEEWELMNNDGK